MRMVFSFLLAVICLLSACSDQPPVDPSPRITGPTMGTTYTLLVPGLSDADHTTLSNAVAVELQNINQSMSTYQDDSAISQFNRSRDTDWFTVSDAFASVTAAALQIAAASDGAFDPTVGPLVRRWGFGAGDDQPIPPPADELQQLLKQVGYRHLQVRADPPAIRKNFAGLQLDLSAIAKGYAVDRVAELTAQLGYDNYLVEIGGELRVNGRSEQNKPWHIGVEQPAADGTETQSSLALTGGGVASSGDYRNFRRAQGKKYSHIIDPVAGQPVQHGLAAVTVVANTAMHADGWATALMVLGPQRGREYA
ncbi:MAG: FAD:protein FMN transferase, partial [Pseudomonadota bacterium]